MTLIVPSTFDTVRRTSVPFGPNFFLPHQSHSHNVNRHHFLEPLSLLSLPFKLFSAQAGPPEISSDISVKSFFFWRRAPIPSNLPLMLTSKRSFLQVQNNLYADHTQVMELI
jgi:hypothetical protein